MVFDLGSVLSCLAQEKFARRTPKTDKSAIFPIRVRNGRQSYLFYKWIKVSFVFANAFRKKIYLLDHYSFISLDFVPISFDIDP